jgi:hypothetical protein
MFESKMGLPIQFCAKCGGWTYEAKFFNSTATFAKEG